MINDLNEKPIPLEGLSITATYAGAYKPKVVFRKMETVKSNELNFYVPEKWNYENGNIGEIK